MARKLISFLFFIFLSIPAWATDYSQDVNALGMWTAEEGTGTTTEDVTANTNTGTFTSSGNPAWYNTSTAGAWSSWALNFDSDYVDCGTGAGLTGIGGTTSTYTVVLWTNRLSTDTSNQNMVSHGTYEFGRYPFVFSQAGGAKPRIYIYDGTNAPGADDSTTMSANTWTFLVGIRHVSDDKIYLYRNGSGNIFSATDTTTATCANTAKTVIGGNQNGDLSISGSYTEIIDDVAIFGDALTTTEIDDIYSNGFGVAPPATGYGQVI